eukprot:6551756-Pyramimonas_sp.AAC.1
MKRLKATYMRQQSLVADIVRKDVDQQAQRAVTAASQRIDRTVDEIYKSNVGQYGGKYGKNTVIYGQVIDRSQALGGVRSQIRNQWDQSGREYYSSRSVIDRSRALGT